MLNLRHSHHVFTNLSLDHADELTAILAVAGQIAAGNGLATQELTSGFLATEATAPVVMADHIVVTRASSAKLTAPMTVLVTLAEPVRWGAGAGQMIDSLVAVILPAGAGESEYDRLKHRIATTVATHAWPTTPRELELLRQAFTAA